jgi:hypothetical protein
MRTAVKDLYASGAQGAPRTRRLAPPFRFGRARLPAFHRGSAQGVWWSLGAIRARLRGCFATAADMTAGSAPTSSGAPRTPVIVPAGLMPGPPGSRLMRPARGLRTRPLPSGITRLASFMGRVSPYVSINRTDVNGGVTKKFARIPGAARCAADPGSLKAPRLRRSRISGAPPQRVEDARERAYGAAPHPGNAAYFCSSQVPGTGPWESPLPSEARRGEKVQETSL